MDPEPLLKITDDTQTYTGAPLTTAYVGQRVRLHIYILPHLRGNDSAAFHDPYNSADSAAFHDLQYYRWRSHILFPLRG